MIDIPDFTDDRLVAMAKRVDLLFMQMQEESGLTLHWTFSFGLEDATRPGEGGPVYVSGGDNPLASLMLAFNASAAHTATAKLGGATQEQILAAIKAAKSWEMPQ